MGLFTKEHNNENFYLELTKKHFDEQWLEEALKSEFIDINHQDAEGNTILLRCLKKSRYKSVEWLIKHGAEVHTKNKAGKSAINLAIEKNSLPVVKGLLELGKIDVNQRDIDGRSLLQNVVVWGNIKMAKLLIRKGADINNTDHHNRNVLYDALSYGDRGFFNYFLAFEDIDLNNLDENGNTLFQHREIQKNDLLAIDLLKAGADPTILTATGESYLYNVILREEEAKEIIQTALQHGANANALTKNGNTLMMELIELVLNLPEKKEETKKYYLEIAQLMLDHGGNLNLTNKGSETILFDAVRVRDYAIIAFLLSNGIDPNIQNEYGETPLFDIILDGSKSRDLILLLLAYKANPNLINQDGKTVYEVLNDIIIHQHGAKKINDRTFLSKLNLKSDYFILLKELLEQEESDLDYLDSSGNPLFFNPLLYDCFALFKLYINYIDINLLNQSGHNIFYEYALSIFEKNDTSSKALDNFESHLSTIISHKANKNFQDALGWTVPHKILTTPCDERLFRILTKVVLFDYTIKDNLGRSVIHNAVWGNKPYVIEIIENIAPSTINQIDKYGILPITYAALLGNQKLVLHFIKHGSNIHGDKKIAPQAVKKFNPMLKNLPKLLKGVTDKTDLDNLHTIIEQVRRDFSIQ